jgi:hypothetical protein
MVQLYLVALFSGLLAILFDIAYRFLVWQY